MTNQGIRKNHFNQKFGQKLDLESMIYLFENSRYEGWMSTFLPRPSTVFLPFPSDQALSNVLKQNRRKSVPQYIEY